MKDDWVTPLAPGPLEEGARLGSCPYLQLIFGVFVELQGKEGDTSGIHRDQLSAWTLSGQGRDAMGQGQPAQPLPPAQPLHQPPRKGLSFSCKVSSLSSGHSRATGTVSTLPVVQSFVPFLWDPTGGGPPSWDWDVPGTALATWESLTGSMPDGGHLECFDCGPSQCWAFHCLQLQAFQQWTPLEAFGRGHSN